VAVQGETQAPFSFLPFFSSPHSLPLSRASSLSLSPAPHPSPVDPVSLLLRRPPVSRRRPHKQSSRAFLLLLRLLLKDQLQSPHGYMLFYALYTQYLIFLRMACLEELRVSWGWCCCYLSLTRTLCVCMFNGLWSNVLFVR
jgi:hypothetical protein